MVPPPDLNLRPEQAASVVINATTTAHPSGRDVSFRYAPPAYSPMHAPGSSPRVEYTQPNPPGPPPPPMAYRPLKSPVPPIAVPSMVSISSSKKRPLSAVRVQQSEKKTSKNKHTHSQGGTYADDEHIRRIERAGRFKEDAAFRGVSQRAKKKSDHKDRQRNLLDRVVRQGDPLSIDWDAFAIQGTCKNLEKSYFRLTSAPDPSTVRPAPVLRRALSRLVDLIASGDVNYFYSQDQFKGMRQDCVVQALKGDLTVDIYEAHARAALEYGDMAEYNQCQGQLRLLYTSTTRKNEFIAYRILYQSMFSFLNKNKGEVAVGLLESLGDVGSTLHHLAERDNVTHALDVRKALISNNYAAFFTLYDCAPALGRALMDLAVPKLRFKCLEAFLKAFKMRLEVGEFLCSVLGFFSHSSSISESKSRSPFYKAGCSRYSTGEFEGKHRGVPVLEDALEECLEWLGECGVVFFEHGSNDDSSTSTPSGTPLILDCKESLRHLKMPEEKDAVAHGDANLDVADFFKTIS
jgi:hypothetical protein